MTIDTLYTVGAFWLGEYEGKTGFVQGVATIIGPAGQEDVIREAYPKVVERRGSVAHIKDAKCVNVVVRSGPYPIPLDPEVPADAERLLVAPQD